MSIKPMQDFLKRFLGKKSPEEHIPYQVRVSPRAKKIRLRILQGVGLEVVLPRGYPQSKVKQILRGNREWIQAHKEAIEQAARQVISSDCLPQLIYLPAVNQTFQVHYPGPPQPEQAAPVSASGQVYVWKDPRTSPEVCCLLLQEWLKKQARATLRPWAEDLSRRYRLPVNKIQVRRQKTRWASFSGRGTLSLNCFLLFLRPALVHHVLLHELAHVRHPNHGPEFKAFLARLSPEHRRYEQELKTLPPDTIPMWARVRKM